MMMPAEAAVAFPSSWLSFGKVFNPGFLGFLYTLSDNKMPGGAIFCTALPRAMLMSDNFMSFLQISL